MIKVSKLLSCCLFYPVSQIPPDSLLPPSYSLPSEPDNLIERTEVERRVRYFELLGDKFKEPHPLVIMIKKCLDNEPSERCTAEELLSALQEMVIYTEQYIILLYVHACIHLQMHTFVTE